MRTFLFVNIVTRRQHIRTPRHILALACSDAMSTMPSETDVALAFILVVSFASAVIVLIVECLQSFACSSPSHAAIDGSAVWRSRRESVQKLVASAFPFQPLEEPQMSCRECTICLDPIHKGASVISLDCEHVFHARCIARWLLEEQYEPACPTCKADPFPWPTWTCCFCCRVRLPFDEAKLLSFSMAAVRDEVSPRRHAHVIV